MSVIRLILLLAMATVLFLAPPLAVGPQAAENGVSSTAMATDEPHDHDGGLVGHMHDLTGASDHSHEAGGFCHPQPAGPQVRLEPWQGCDTAMGWPCIRHGLERPPRTAAAS